MASLRDRLRAAVPQKAAAKPAPEDCYVRRQVIPPEAFSLAPVLTGEQLYLLQGSEFASCRREDILFLDTETTGLSHGAGTVAFLVGVGFFERDGFHVEQYLMRDYDEEIFVLQHVAPRLAACGLLCTFNGASFDMPLLENRFTMQRMRSLYTLPPHVDLLHASRRVWKLRLRKCNLSALENAVLGLEREDDLPGALVPERYFTYLKTKEFFLLEDILRHNAQDIVSLAHILHRLVTLHDTPLLAAQAPEDLFSLGSIYEKRGRTEGARQCWRAADKGTVSLLARTRMAESYRREGLYGEAEEIYRRMIASRQGGITPLIAMAKICEHKKRDIPAAIEYTRKAIILAADQEGADMAALQKRYERLLTKARRNR